MQWCNEKIRCFSRSEECRKSVQEWHFAFVSVITEYLMKLGLICFDYCNHEQELDLSYN